MEEDQSSYTNSSERCVVCDYNCGNLRRGRILGNRLDISSWVSAKYLPDYFIKFIFSCVSSSVIGLYTSYAAPIFLRITTGRSTFKPGPFSLGRWAVPVGTIAVAWVAYIVVLLFFPPGQATTAQGMSEWVNSRAENLKVDVIFQIIRWLSLWGYLSLRR